MSTIKGLRERLRDGEDIICAEGYVYEMERRGFLKLGDYTPQVVLDHPDRVKALSEEFVMAGSDVVQAFTYFGHRASMQRIGRDDELEKLNLQALRIAKEVATASGCLMAGGICNTTVYDAKDQGAIEYTEAMFKEQIEWAVQSGADYMIGETFMEFGEAKLALESIKKYGQGLPAVITLAIFDSDSTIDDVPAAQALAQLESLGADVVGFNCSRGPDNMLPLLEQARGMCKVPLAALPAPIRISETVRTMYSARDPRDNSMLYSADLDCVRVKRSEIRQFAVRAKQAGVRYIGLCCGNSPAQTRELALGWNRNPESAQFAPEMDKFIYQPEESLTERKKLYRNRMFGEDLISYVVASRAGKNPTAGKK